MGGDQVAVQVRRRPEESAGAAQHRQPDRPAPVLAQLLIEQVEQGPGAVGLASNLFSFVITPGMRTAADEIGLRGGAGSHGVFRHGARCEE